MTLDLPLIWFLLIAVLWTGYLILEGFDFGVGMLLPILGKGVDPAHTDKRRRVLLNTIGPVWDGNEVWILTAGGATFAAFPEWYATLFSGFYLPLLLILVALIIRNMGFDYRGKRADATWAARWDLAIIIGSFLPALLWGVALTNIVHGVPLNADHEYTGTLLTLLNPLALLGGIVTTGLFLTHGALFLTLKTDGGIRHDARAFATKAGLTTAVLAVILLGWLGLTKGTTASWATTVIAATTDLPQHQTPRRVRLHRHRHHHRRNRRDLLPHALPQRHALHHQPQLLPHHHQRLLHPLHPQNHDDRRTRLHPHRPDLPKLDLLDLPQTPHHPPHPRRPRPAAEAGCQEGQSRRRTSSLSGLPVCARPRLGRSGRLRPYAV